MTIEIDKYREHPLFALALAAFNGTVVKKARERKAAITCEYYDYFRGGLLKEDDKQLFDRYFQKELEFLALGDAPGARLNASRMRKMQENILEKRLLKTIIGVH